MNHQSIYGIGMKKARWNRFIWDSQGYLLYNQYGFESKKEQVTTHGNRKSRISREIIVERNPRRKTKVTCFRISKNIIHQLFCFYLFYDAFKIHLLFYYLHHFIYDLSSKWIKIILLSAMFLPRVIRCSSLLYHILRISGYSLFPCSRISYSCNQWFSLSEQYVCRPLPHLFQFHHKCWTKICVFLFIFKIQACDFASNTQIFSFIDVDWESPMVVFFYKFSHHILHVFFIVR